MDSGQGEGEGDRGGQTDGGLVWPNTAPCCCFAVILRGGRDVHVLYILYWLKTLCFYKKKTVESLQKNFLLRGTFNFISLYFCLNFKENTYVKNIIMQFDFFFFKLNSISWRLNHITLINTWTELPCALHRQSNAHFTYLLMPIIAIPFYFILQCVHL